MNSAWGMQSSDKIQMTTKCTNLQLHLKFICFINIISELEALIFLHACYNSVEKAKACLDTYFTCRTHCPEFFGKRDVNGADVTAQMKIL